MVTFIYMQMTSLVTIYFVLLILTTFHFSYRHH